VTADRPRVLLNCALSVDGKIALPNRQLVRISSPPDWLRVHELRAQADAVLVGIGTILADDPSLLVDTELVPTQRQPLRVVLDSHGRIPSRSRVLQGGAPTLVAVAHGGNTAIAGAEVVVCGQGRVALAPLLADLRSRGIRTVLVEGGEEVNWSFLRGGIFDELTVFVGSLIIGGRGPTLAGGSGIHALEAAIALKLIDAVPTQGGVLLRYQPA